MRCPVCAEPADLHVTAPCTRHELWCEGVPPELEWWKCRSCGHLFEVSGFDREILADRATKIGIPCATNVLKERDHWAWTFQALDLPRGSRVLDFGCGSGVAGFVAREFELEPTFIDMKPRVRELIRAFGEPRVYPSLFDVPSDATFDLIILSDVVEHLREPKAVLTALTAYGRRMLLSTPMPEGPVWQEIGENNPYWWEIEHYHVFSARSLARTLREANWTIVKRSPGLRYLCGAEFLCVKGTV